MIQPSSVTKRNLMVGMVKCSGMVYTPHQCWYSDRKFPLLGERPKSAKMCLKNIKNSAKHSAKLVIPILNPLHHT